MTIAERLRQEGHLNGLQEGHRKGLQEGLQTGLQQGKREEALRIASTMEADGIDPLTIFRITGLTARIWLRAAINLRPGEHGTTGQHIKFIVSVLTPQALHSIIRRDANSTSHAPLWQTPKTRSAATVHPALGRLCAAPARQDSRTTAGKAFPPRTAVLADRPFSGSPAHH